MDAITRAVQGRKWGKGMTNNDYIAEYIKEKYPDLLGFDYALWKTIKVITNAFTKLVGGEESKCQR